MVSEHFARREFACKCRCGFDTVDVELVTYLEMIRNNFNKPVIINSGCRCHNYNTRIHGASKSQHKIGRAADITINGVTPKEIADYAESIGVPGIGRYKTFTHIDSRVNPARWGSNA